MQQSSTLFLSSQPAAVFKAMQGKRVRVHGLQKKPEYNDRAGTVKGEVAGGRWCVLLDGEHGGNGSRELSLKPENFSALDLSAAEVDRLRS